MRKYENYAAALVSAIIERYIPEFERLRAGLLDRYQTMLTAPDRA